MDRLAALQQGLDKQAKGDDVGLEFEYDGAYHPVGSGAGFVREKVLALRQMVDGVQSGEVALDALHDLVASLTQAMAAGRQRCLELAERPMDDERKAAFRDTAEAMERSHAALHSMTRALASDDLESLLAGQEAFEAAVRHLDSLVADEKARENS